MFLKYTNIKEIFCKYDYDEASNSFSVFNSDKSMEITYQSVISLDDAYNPQNFEMTLLENKNASENSIFCVYADDIRVGWIFPVQALLSAEHEYANNIHFLRYAYIAICKLIACIDEKDVRDFTTDFDLLDFYRSEQQILLVDKENIAQIPDYSIEHYVVSLFLKGYSFTGKGNAFVNVDSINKNLKLTSLPDELRKIEYINTLFKNLIPLEMEAFSKFHVLYQIIELLIIIVFQKKFVHFVEKFKDTSLELKSNSGKLFDDKNELDSMMGEKNRVRWLMNNYTAISQDKKEILNDYCKEILEKNQRRYSENMPENLYDVRCLIVHSLYTLDDCCYNQILPGLNDAFLAVILEMLQSFSIPN